ncbi:MAG: class I SAM-dependent RNA methyltransferase [Acidobacteria bacterium]|nr:class I SAM-dependent RNA methyltransferase [Acidobacteriota bacterium]
MKILELRVERAVAGGRMLARHDGMAVLVAGAIPGERVRAEVERSTRSMVWARTIEVIEAAPSRREPAGDPACGGLDYAHIGYAEQRRCKAELIADALRRIGRVELDEPVDVAASHETGYRLRARLHVRGRRAGFFREGTHELCDAGATGQMRADTMAAILRAMDWLGDHADDVSEIVVSENIAATERVLHLTPRPDRDLASLPPPDAIAGLTGMTTIVRGRLQILAGRAEVADTATDLFGPDAPVPAATRWTRRSTSFFQANRYLVGALVGHVLASTPGARVADLYAGVGLFATAFGASGREVIAVEGEASAAGDLQTNAAPWPPLRMVHGAVERAIARLEVWKPDAVVLDPPRTGAGGEALAGIVGLGAARIVYVSCDPPTLARDTARLVSAGYVLRSARAFDLFPNTAHVETVVVFDATSRAR